MEFSDVNRRGFLKTSVAAAAAGAGISAGSLSAAALSIAEVKEWQSRVGSCFKIGNSEVQLQRVNVADHSADAARPDNIRTQSIAMLFVLQSGRIHAERDRLMHDGQQLYVTQVIAPRDKSGEFFELILN